MLAAASLLPLAVWAQTAQDRAAAAGELARLKRQKVLRLFGPEAKERGFAHGYLLGDEIVACIAEAFSSLPLFTAEKFEQRLRPWALRQFHWDAEARAELEGLYEGLLARVGSEGLRSEFLGRQLQPEDLYAINVIADYFGPGCSGFTAAGALTEGGRTVHGRNLDFPLGNRAAARQIVFAVDPLPARDGRPARRAWVGVGWPGLATFYSAMNAEGLVCCLHDAENVIRSGPRDGYAPRGLLLRRIVETIDPAAGDPAEAARAMAAERPSACGNLFHLSWPRAATKTTGTRPAAVLEFDAAGRQEGGTPVDVRRMDETDFLPLTNHYCVRKSPPECDRFRRLLAGAAAIRESGRTIDLQTARRLLASVELPVAAHTLVFFPDERRLCVSISVGSVLSTRRPGVEFAWQELFERKEAGAQRQE